MLEEIVTFVLSVFSLFKAPQVSFDEESENLKTTDVDFESDNALNSYMNKEYEYLGVEDNYSETNVLLSSLRSQNATVIDNMQMTRRKFCDSFMNSILTTLNITLASIVQTSVAIVFR